MDGPGLRAAIALGCGAGMSLLAAVMMIVGGYRVDARGEDPYPPELGVLAGALLLGIVLAAAAGLRLCPGAGRR